MRGCSVNASIVRSNTALLTDAYSSPLRTQCGAAKRGRQPSRIDSTPKIYVVGRLATSRGGDGQCAERRRNPREGRGNG